MVHLEKKHICQSIALQNSMLPLLRKISATGLQSAIVNPFFFSICCLGFLSDISQAKKAQERQADMQVDVASARKLPRKTDAGTCYVLMYYL